MILDADDLNEGNKKRNYYYAVSNFATNQVFWCPVQVLGPYVGVLDP